MNYWIFKSEPDEFGIDHLAAQERQTARWDGIRNYQARNNLRDLVKTNDKVLFYHSSCKNIGIAGTMEVVKAAYPDPSQFDPDSEYYDAKSDPDNPRYDYLLEAIRDVNAVAERVRERPSQRREIVRDHLNDVYYRVHRRRKTAGLPLEPPQGWRVRARRRINDLLNSWPVPLE